MKFLFAILAAAAIVQSSPAQAAVIRKIIDYRVDIKSVAQTGVLVFDSTTKANQPGLVMIPNWMGINEANIAQAELVAKMGYVVFVADMYGNAVRPKNAGEAGKAAGAVKADRGLMRQRASAALTQLVAASKEHNVKLNTRQLGAIGFCFGGTSALELARSGAPIMGAVSFHGGLESSQPYDAKKVSAAFLALHGADDPYVPAAEVTAFQDEMRKNALDWELVSYGGAVHSFTDVDANAPGQAQYNKKVAARAYARMQTFFNGLFGK